ncbi:rhodanese-related sulfurtransferase [Antricoccus suffuscus]|uniref:Rhodanese-related sulfurtransferase n=1 Tax=Antricoccus suffuscus TaxID=1629062 RepID=A0A2T1A5T0_9ACTN|nr:rhodanese-like domain-containing protein [Antricoccus suffuscus]PRZ43698.1 rhodanese-related sulfurtransferase [Antricoccus suffuscus]
MTDRTPSAAAAQPAVDLSLEDAGALAPLVTPQDAATRIADGAFHIDVRSETGRATAGTIPGATAVDRNELDALFDQASAQKLPAAKGLDTPIVVSCGSVRGSGPVAAVLRDKGYTDVVHVEGGFDGWKQAGLPTDPPGGSINQKAGQPS